MKLIQALALLIVAIGFVAAATLVRPVVKASLAEQRALKKAAEAKKLDTGEKQGGRLGDLFGYERLIPEVDVARPSRSDLSESVPAPGRVSPGSEVAVGAPFSGTVLGLAVDEGDQVEKGALMFALDPTENKKRVSEMTLTLKLREASVQEARAELAEAETKLAERREKGEVPAEVREAQLTVRKSSLSVEQSQARSQNAKSKAKRARLLFDKGLGTEVEVEAADSELRVSKLQLQLSEKDLQLARDSLEIKVENAARDLRELEKAALLTKLRLERGETDRDIARLNLTGAKEDLAKTRIVAPISGIVTARNINSGENVTRNDSQNQAATHYIISDFSHMYIYADVDEGDITKVKPEQRVEVRVAALGDDQVLRGRVVSVGNRAAQDGETLYFRVRVLIVDAPPTLRPGMTANVEIETKRSDDALCVAIQAVGQRRRRDLSADILGERSKGRGSETLDVVLVASEGKAEVRLVELGISDGDQVELRAGLSEQDEIIVGPYRELEKLKHGDPVKITSDKRGAKPGARRDGQGAERAHSKPSR